MLGNLKLYGLIALGLFVGYLLWREKYLSDRLKSRNAELASVTATLNAERINTEKANASAKRYAERLQIARGPRSPPERIVCKLPTPKAASAAASGTHDPPVTDDAGVSQDVDVGPLLDVPFRACEENLIKLEELQQWVRERS